MNAVVADAEAYGSPDAELLLWLRLIIRSADAAAESATAAC